MSKMSELSQVLDEMIACGEGMIKAAKVLQMMYELPNKDQISAQG